MPNQLAGSGAHKFWVLVPAAGIGARMGADRPKQYLPLAGQPVLERTLRRLLDLAAVDSLVVAINPFDSLWPTLAVAQDSRVETVDGGQERCDSVLNGLRHLEGRADKLDWVLVHDAARPCVRVETIQILCESLQDHLVGGILGVPVSDTLKQLDEHFGIQATLDRHALWHAQTPQMFRYGLLKQALEAAVTNKRVVTDEASALEAMGYCPRMVEGSRDNIKITRPEDLALAEMILARQQAQGEGGVRVGHGYDVHAFGAGDKIVIGGVVIPHSRGLIAHSDGDVLLHALCDALLGAIAAGDIGRHFPDTDAQYRNVDSRTLLRLVYTKVKAAGLRLGNADLTVVAETPRMAPYISYMVANIAADLDAQIGQVNVKATTTEKLGFTGRGEGIAAHAVVLLTDAGQ